MKVRDFKKFLEGIEDNTELVIRGSDHRYSKAYFYLENAVSENGELVEYDEDSTNARPIEVIVFE